MTEPTPVPRRRRYVAVGLLAGLGAGSVAGLAWSIPAISGAQEDTTTSAPEETTTSTAPEATTTTVAATTTTTPPEPEDPAPPAAEPPAVPDQPSNETPEDTGKEPRKGRAGWYESALKSLVEDGTITQEQADRVAERLREAGPARSKGRWHHRRGGHGKGVRLEAAAGALGMSEDELRQALRSGQSIAEVAAARGVEVQKVVDVLVAEASQRLDQAVAEGRITKEQADRRKADLTERITAMVND